VQAQLVCCVHVCSPPSGSVQLQLQDQTPAGGSGPADGAGSAAPAQSQFHVDPDVGVVSAVAWPLPSHDQFHDQVSETVASPASGTITTTLRFCCDGSVQVVVPSTQVVVWVIDPLEPGLPTRTETLTLLVWVCFAFPFATAVPLTFPLSLPFA
jgi:hypothetical protein